MPPSPFHGIFSSLGSGPSQGSGGGHPMRASRHDSGAFSMAPDMEEELVQETAMPTTKGGKTGQIAVDIYELDNYYIIRAPIAGVKLSDIDIEVDDKILTIRGTREAADEVPSSQFYLEECFWGEFTRSITLPVSIDPKKVKATFSKDSILKILIPKEEKVKIVRVSEG